MAPASAGAHSYQACPQCGGAWMDVSEFLSHLRAVQPHIHCEELLQHNDGTPRRPCPRCGELMTIAWLEFLKLDQCDQHGIWFGSKQYSR